MGSKKKAGPPPPRRRDLKVSHKRRVEVIDDLRAMRRDLECLELRIKSAEAMIQEDYWPVG